MKRKELTGPFWVIVVLVALYALSAVNVWARGERDDTGLWFEVLSLVWTGVLAGEAMLYWRIRTRNSARKESWAHVVVLVFTFLVPALRGAMIEAFFGGVFGEVIGQEMLAFFFWEKTALYWTLTGIAHIFFARVVWKAFVVRQGEGKVPLPGDRKLPGGAKREAKPPGEAPPGGMKLPGGAVTIKPELGREDLLDDVWN